MKKSESTDLALAESLRTLMMHMPFEKITIKDITDEANVIRTTFYNHFQDKYDLLDWIYYEYYIKPSNQLIENNMLLEAFKLMTKNMEHDKEFLLKATRGNQDSMKDVMFRSYKDAVLKSVKSIGVDLPSINPLFTDELVAEYYANNVTFIVLKWIDMDMEIPSDKVVELFQMMFVTSIEGFL
ncbi:MAG: TetR family transcriptional regulator [Anaerovoracaceae bacterium]